MDKKFSKQNSDGFTLIEIIASIAILGMVIAVFLPIFPQIMSWTEKTDDQLIASNLLDQITYDVEEKFKTESEGTNCASAVSEVINNYSYDGAYTTKIDMSQSLEEKKYGLYRIHIKVYSDDKPDNMLTDTYMYLSCEGDSND